MTAGPRRLGLHRGNVTRAQDWLDDWARTWQPVIGDLTAQPGGGRRLRRPSPSNDRIDDAIATYATHRGRELHP